MLNLCVNGHSSTGRATVSKTVGWGFESSCPCLNVRTGGSMERIKLYIKESYNELVNKVTWPSWGNLQSSTVVVVIASLILALVIFLMDVISKGILDQVYGIG